MKEPCIARAAPSHDHHVATFGRCRSFELGKVVAELSVELPQLPSTRWSRPSQKVFSASGISSISSAFVDVENPGAHQFARVKLTERHRDPPAAAIFRLSPPRPMEGLVAPCHPHPATAQMNVVVALAIGEIANEQTQNRRIMIAAFRHPPSRFPPEIEPAAYF